MISRLSYPRLFNLASNLGDSWENIKYDFSLNAKSKDIVVDKGELLVEGIEVPSLKELKYYFDLNAKEIPVSAMKSLLVDIKDITDFKDLERVLKDNYGFTETFRYGKNAIRINKRNFKFRREFINYLQSMVYLEDIISSSNNCEVIQDGNAVVLDSICYISSGRVTYDDTAEDSFAVCGYLYYSKVIWKCINKSRFKKVGDYYVLSINSDCFYPNKIKEGRIVNDA